MGNSKIRSNSDDGSIPLEGKKKGSHHRDPCLPPHQKTYLTIGQDLYSIQEYLREQRNATLHWYMRSVARHHNNEEASLDLNGPSDEEDDDHSGDNYQPRIPVPRPEVEVPAAIMVYTDIQKLRGLDTPIDYGTGIEYADGALRMASPPNNNLGLGLQIGLWLGGAKGCKDVVSGRLDHKVDQLVLYLGQVSPASKIWLRIGYEFDNPQFLYSADPESFKLAFEYIVNKCNKKKSCRRKVVMVWHSWAAGLPANATLDDFYPGDDLVDWVGISVFQQFYPNDVGGTVKDLENVLEFAADHEKPTMIAESTPFGGIRHNAILGEGADLWKAWFEPTLHLIKEYDIAMWSYINCNWNAQPLWVGTGFGDTRLSIDPVIMDKWYDFVTGSRQFVRATDHELCSYQRRHENDDDDNFHFKSSQYHPSYDDDGLMYSQNGHHQTREVSQRRKFWGQQRLGGSEGLWEAVLPIVMLSSSLAIVLFMFYSTRRRASRLDRTPRAQRLRFAFLDAMQDNGDESAALYGSTDDCASTASSRRSSVRRVGRTLIVADTADGTTIVA